MTDNGSFFVVPFSFSFLNSVTRHCIIVFLAHCTGFTTDGKLYYREHSYTRSTFAVRPDFIRSFSCCVFFRSRGDRGCDNGRHNKSTTIRDDATRVLSWTPSVSSARRYPNRARYKGFAAGVAALQPVLVPADVTK